METILHEFKVKRLFSRYGVRFAYLFGSRATGKGKIAASDYDFAVYFGAGTGGSRFKKRLKLMAELQELFAPVPIDLVVLDDIRSVVLRYEVIANGRLIFVKDTNARIDFEFRSMHDYYDFSPYLRAYNMAYTASAKI